MLTPLSGLAGHGGSGSPGLNVVGHLDLGHSGANITDVWAQGNYAYLGTFDEGLCSLDMTGVHIVDISNPANPEKVGFIPAKPGTRNNYVKVAHIETRFFDSKILVASNEGCGSPFIPKLHARGGGFIPGQGGLSIWDVSYPSNIVETDQFAIEGVLVDPVLSGDRTMHNVVVDGGTQAYISWYAEGIRVVDFAGDNISEVAHFVDTVDGSNFWGVYLHDHPDGNTYVLGSDRSTGLWIFDTP